MKKLTLMILITLFLVPFVYAQECTDTDDGRYYYEKGDIELPNGRKASDRCKNSYVLTEFRCSIGYEGWDVNEYYCQHGCKKGACKCVIDDDCPPKKERYCNDDYACTFTTTYNCVNSKCVHAISGGGCGPCQLGCQNGVCIGEEITCWSDNDCSQNQFCEFDQCLAETGQCVDVPDICPPVYSPVCGCDGKTYSNDCNRKAAGVSKKHDGECPDHCSNGIKDFDETDIDCGGSCPACSGQCTDSDGGLNYYVKGTATDSLGSYTDTCTDSSSITEYYCQNNGVLISYSSCPDGYTCSNGACIQGTTGTTVSITPSSKSVNNGDTFTLDIEVSNVNNLYAFQFDISYNSNILELTEAVEGTFLSNNGNDDIFCLPPENSTGLIKNIACTRLVQTSISGSGVLQRITFKAIAEGQSSVTLSNVKLAKSDSTEIGRTSYNGNVVVGGAGQCTDSDGGLNYNVKGTITGYESPGVISSFTDYCGLAGDETGKLKEYYCGENDIVKFILYTCPNSCQNGACILEDKPDFVVNGFFMHTADLAPKEGKLDRMIFLKVENLGKELIPANVLTSITVYDLQGNLVDECQFDLWQNWFTNKESIIKDNCTLDLDAGKYLFEAYIDNNNQFEELDETNNKYSQNIEIVPDDFSCIDDDLYDEYTKGTTIGYDAEHFKVDTFYDYCTVGCSTEQVEEEEECKEVDQVVEYICSLTNNEPTNQVTYIHRDCLYGCKNGACIQDTTGTTVSITPSSKSVNNGDTFTLDIEVSNVNNLYAFQFDISYNSNILELTEAVEGTFLSNNGNDYTFCVPPENSTGLIKNIACTRLVQTSISGSGVLQRITFKAIAEGQSSVTLSNVKLAKSDSTEIVSTSYNGNVVVGVENKCLNNILDPGETDIDCGGSTCVACSNGKKCQVNNDCKSNYCNPSNICSTPPTPSCTDSDGGINYYVKGSCSETISYGSGGGGGGGGPDHCQEDRVIECYCDNNELKLTNYPCPHGCKDGACIEQPQPEKIFINLKEGWNLISIPGTFINFDMGSVMGEKLIGYVYIKEEQKYYTIEEAEKLLGDAIREYITKNAFWIYTKKPLTLTVYIYEAISLNDIDIVKGWNLVPITKDMVDNYLTDITGNCNIEKTYLWDPYNQDWIKIDLQYLFSTSQISQGFVMKSNNYCTLSEPAILPPTMPE